MYDFCTCLVVAGLGLDVPFRFDINYNKLEQTFEQVFPFVQIMPLITNAMHVFKGLITKQVVDMITVSQVTK